MQVEIKKGEKIFSKDDLTKSFREHYMHQSTPVKTRRFIEPFLLYGFDFVSEYENVNPFASFALTGDAALTVYEEGKLSAIDYVIPCNMITLLGDGAKKKAVHDWKLGIVGTTSTGRIEQMRVRDAEVAASVKKHFDELVDATVEATNGGEVSLSKALKSAGKKVVKSSPVVSKRSKARKPYTYGMKAPARKK